MNKALNLMRFANCKQRGGDYITISSDNHCIDVSGNGKSEPKALINFIEDTSCNVEKEVIEKIIVFDSEIIDYLLKLF